MSRVKEVHIAEFTGDLYPSADGGYVIGGRTLKDGRPIDLRLTREQTEAIHRVMGEWLTDDAPCCYGNVTSSGQFHEPGCQGMVSLDKRHRC